MSAKSARKPYCADRMGFECTFQNNGILYLRDRTRCISGLPDALADDKMSRLFLNLSPAGAGVKMNFNVPRFNSNSNKTKEKLRIQYKLTYLIMKNIVLFFFAGLMFISCSQAVKPDADSKHEKASVSAPDSVNDGVFIHITESYNDPHRVLMPLKMATMMAKDKDVIVYLDIHAVELLVKGAKDLNYAEFESAHTYIKQLADKKVGVYACPTCLKIAGFKPEDLMDGVQLAQKDKFFNFTKGRIISLDY